MQQSFASLAEGLDIKAYKDWAVFDQRLKTLVREESQACSSVAQGLRVLRGMVSE
jgi:hypothetical protein